MLNVANEKNLSEAKPVGKKLLEIMQMLFSSLDWTKFCWNILTIYNFIHNNKHNDKLSLKSPLLHHNKNSHHSKVRSGWCICITDHKARGCFIYQWRNAMQGILTFCRVIRMILTISEKKTLTNVKKGTKDSWVHYRWFVPKRLKHIQTHLCVH